MAEPLLGHAQDELQRERVAALAVHDELHAAVRAPDVRLSAEHRFLHRPIGDGHVLREEEYPLLPVHVGLGLDFHAHPGQQRRGRLRRHLAFGLHARDDETGPRRFPQNGDLDDPRRLLGQDRARDGQRHE